MELTLGDLKPTQLLHKMQALATDSISTKFFWLDRLPPSVRSVISVLDGDLEELAKKADKYLRCSNFPVMAVTESPILDKAVAALNDQVSALSNRLAVAEERQQIQMVNSTKSSSDEQRYYHRRFGAQAKKCRLPCSFTKKRPKGAVMATTSTPHIPRRLFITDGVLQLQFLIDTGADLSVLPRKICTATRPSTVCLYSATGSCIQTYGQRQLSLNLGLDQPVTWTFVVADVTTPILGADFLTHYGISVDMRNKRLVSSNM
uniref:Uncharacterized protein LOC114328356 n=1 Tax=Diabrotica virgifera virgifera TaxID=50390 RepID=A0A6P7FDT8_DIAVI